MLTKLKDLSIVKLNTNKTGTVVHCYDDKHFTVEIDDEDLRDISIEEIEEIIWKPE